MRRERIKLRNAQDGSRLGATADLTTLKRVVPQKSESAPSQSRSKRLQICQIKTGELSAQCRRADGDVRLRVTEPLERGAPAPRLADRSRLVALSDCRTGHSKTQILLSKSLFGVKSITS
jgi:hypothetical protein